MKSSRRAPPSQAKRTQCGQRLTERRLRQANLAVDRVRHAERPERRLERCAQPVDARADDADALGAHARAQQGEQLLADELEGAARACALEEPNGAVDRDRLVRIVGEERTLEVGERGVRDLAVARQASSSMRPAARRCKILSGATQ